ncbi:putative secretion ATPase, PEP-CTERM locus subfamily [Sphingobium sp. AP50]|nr:putative secretion ATPase, PEP-CTERM locus subfamily [Sphingobium sp. AP50]
MYDQFYGLQGRPFQLTPDPHYYFESATHRKALSYLGYGLAQGEGFIVITGDIGAGKTTLVGHLMQTIDPARLTAVKIVSTQVEGDDMLRLAAQSFGLATDGQSKAAILHQVEGFLYAQARAGRRTLLIVDEAQNLPVSAVEELRMLSNFQLGGQSLLQIFLLGQPEFRDLIRSPELEQLRQRVIATHHLEPMMAQEVEPYVLHRLSIAGWNGNPAFTPAAFSALYAATGGVPRRLNALVSRVLLLGAIEQLHLIDEDVVGAVVADMGLDVDVAPEPVVASTLDTVEEWDAPEEDVIEEEPVSIADPIEPEEAVSVAEPEEEPAFAAAEVDLVEEAPFAVADVDRLEDEIELVDEVPMMESVEPETEIAAFEPEAEEAEEAEEPVEAEIEETEETEEAVAFAVADTVEEPEPEATRPAFLRPIALVQQEPDEEDAEIFDLRDIDTSARVTPFLRPVTDGNVAPFAPPVSERVVASFAAPVTVDESEDEPVEAFAEEDEALELEQAIAVDTGIETLRSDMLTEIEALRAEIASLRAMQAHAPFAQPAPQAQPEIDPEALKGCFTLIEERLASLEFRAEEQDTALRRVLTLLVDWVEREEQLADAQAVA